MWVCEVEERIFTKRVHINRSGKVAFLTFFAYCKWNIFVGVLIYVIIKNIDIITMLHRASGIEKDYQIYRMLKEEKYDSQVIRLTLDRKEEKDAKIFDDSFPSKTGARRIFREIVIFHFLPFFRE